MERSVDNLGLGLGTETFHYEHSFWKSCFIGFSFPSLDFVSQIQTHIS